MIMELFPLIKYTFFHGIFTLDLIYLPLATKKRVCLTNINNQSQTACTPTKSSSTSSEKHQALNLLRTKIYCRPYVLTHQIYECLEVMNMEVFPLLSTLFFSMVQYIRT
jgi:hypothetical protein